MTIKKVKIVKRPRKQKVNVNKMEMKVSKGGTRCGLDYRQKRGGGCPCGCGCPHCSQVMKGGQVCVGEVLHGCLRREIAQNNVRAQPQNGSNKDYTLHSKYTRFSQNEGNVVNDLVKTNKRSDVSLERIADGRMTGGKKTIKKKGGAKKKSMKKKKGGAKKGQYTKASLKRVTNATPEYAEKHAELAKGGKKGGSGSAGYVKAKNRPARISRISVKPKPVKGGSAGYKKAKSRAARIDSKQARPRAPVKDSSKFA